MRQSMSVVADLGSERATHGSPGVNRVLIDITPKPTGTIERE